MSFGPPLTKGVKLLLLLLAVFSVGLPLLGWANPSLEAQLKLLLVFTPADLWHGYLWQPLTYTFLARDPLDLLLSALLLWMFGSTLEQRWGMRRFLIFYFASVTLAALATALVGLFVHDVASFPYLGNWPAQMAMTAAYSLVLPDAQILLAFVVPVPGRYLVAISAGVTVLFVIMTRTPVPYIPHLFGLAAGLLLARGAAGPKHLLLRLRVWLIERRLSGRKLRVVPGGERKSGTGSDKYLH